ncbi:MAG: low affinity iron permease family protein [bacterium]|nr:low affinity iron permease family protein [bacterium]
MPKRKEKSEQEQPEKEQDVPPLSHDDRIRELKQRASKLSDGQMVTFENEDIPPEIREQFWEHVLAFEEATPVEPFELLVDGGVALPPSSEVDDDALHAKLWELIRGMQFLGMYLLNTDHLSDRELYEVLWEEELRQEAVLEPDNPAARYFIDMVGSGDQEDSTLYLKHYADEEARRSWSPDWPGEIPEHEDPPYDRDRYLPHPDLNPPEPGSEVPV